MSVKWGSALAIQRAGEPSSSVLEAFGAAAGTVVSVLQKCYVLNGRLLRPALVAVAKD